MNYFIHSSSVTALGHALVIALGHGHGGYRAYRRNTGREMEIHTGWDANA